jgi:putative ABC transport system permease protein
VVGRALDRKLLRDLWRIRAQVVAIAMIMASGIGVLVMGLTTVEALDETAQAFYERYRFGQVFAQVKRAPERVAAGIAAIDGVQSVETRIAATAVLDVPGFEEPVTGLFVSLPEDGRGTLNLLALRSGRLPQAGSDREVLVSEPFAQAQRLGEGSRLRAVVNGAWRELTIVGTALSPEFVYAIGPGALMPDDRRFGILWMGRDALAAAYDLDGAFNAVSLSLLRGADPETVVAAVDRRLEPYGGIGAYPRSDQISNWFLTNEIAQLRTLSRLLPAIFLAVAAFLTNMVLARLIAMERSEIGLLKAFGYSNARIGWHYTRFVLAIGTVGVLCGWIAGYWLGWFETRLYAEFYHFPFLLFRPGPTPFVAGALVGFGAALAGALRAVQVAAALPPAEAMRPPAPPMFRRTRLGVALDVLRNVEQLTRIVLRQVGRWPLRSATTAFGIGMSIAVLVIALQWLDAIDYLVDAYFRQAQSQDVTVVFTEPRSEVAAAALGRLPGVLAVEPMRSVPARMRSGSRTQREALQGLPARPVLYRVRDAARRDVTLPSEGVVISSMLGQLLGVGRGDRIEVEVLEGRRERVSVRVVDVFETYIGGPAYIEIGALARLLKQRVTVTAVHLRVDPARQAELLRRLKSLPRVSAVVLRQAAIRTFDETMARTLMIFVSFFIVFSCALSFGVTYNSARVALSERGRELATLRVLGFTRGEISYLLLGEIGLLALVALPVGCAAGYGLSRVLVSAFQTELYRVPFVVEPSTYAWSMGITLFATAVSALLVRRRIDHLDLVAVLKTRE